MNWKILTRYTTPAIGAILALLCSSAGQAASPAGAPVAAKRAWQDMRHGEAVTDDYRWLQQKTQPEVLAYLTAENAYTEALTAPIKPLADQLYAEIKGRMQEADLSVPTRRGAYYYYDRFDAGKQYPVNCRRRADANLAYDAQAPEEILLDRNALAAGQKFFAVRSFAVSPNGRLLAYTTDTSGYRQFTLHIKDLATGQVFADSAERVASLAWAADNRTVFFVQEDATTKRYDRLYRLTLGQAPVQVAHEADERFALEVAATRDQRFITLAAYATDTREVRLLAADRPNGAFRSILGRTKGHRYSLEHHEGTLYITTNRGARNFRVVTAPLATPGSRHWKDFIRHDRNTLVLGLEAFRDYLVVSEQANAMKRTRIYDLKAGTWKTIDFDEAVYLARGAGTPEYTATRYRMSYQSPLTPPMVLDVDMATGARTMLKQQQVVGGFDASQYETRRLWATARDGVKVPLWAVYKKGAKFDGTAPLLLHGYGSYGITIDADFVVSRLSLLDRGVIYVHAQIRGGRDMGEQWHDDGMLMKKKNTFTDFIDSAEFLIQQRWTSPERLIIHGSSAGGLLMGAVTNMRPDLFRAVHADVPFVDMMNSMLDATLPLTTLEYLEWGDPSQKAAYDYMRSYSPYDNVERKAYPAMLVTTGLNDSQVMYWEPVKYVAKLRAFKTDSNPLLLKVNMAAGHGGASGRYEAIRERAFQLAWMLSQWGLNQ